MNFCEQLKSDFEKFLLFQCENKQMNPEELISSTINLMKNCVSSREAILQFYYQFFDELCLLYVNKQNLNNITINHMLFRFLRYYIESETKIKNISDFEKNSQLNSLNDTPLSPPIQTEQNLNVATFFLTIDKFVKKISDTLHELLKEDCLSKKSIINWILKILSTVTANYSPSNITKLNEKIKIWTSNNAILSLLNLIKSHILLDLSENIENVLTELIDLLPNSDWVIAYLITSLPNENIKLTQCLKFLLSNKTSPQSITFILSYLSEHNPQAIISSSKSDIPFLLKLSTTSKPLLNLLAIQVVNEINIDLLNNLNLKENLLNEVLYCILNAPNSFELLNLLFEITKSQKANFNVKQQSFLILESITYKLHQSVYCISAKDQPKLLIADELKNNSKKLICNMLDNSDSILQKLQIRILHLLCVHFGIEYATEIIFNVLNNLNVEYDTNFNINNPPNVLLIHLLKSLKLPFGSDFELCFHEIIENGSDKNPRFWANLLNILETEINIIIDLDTISAKLAEKMQDKTDFFSLYYILLIIQSYLEKYPKETTKSNHRLCISLVGCLIQTIDSLEKIEAINVKIKIITTIQKCMLILCKGQIANQHIICRCLLETELNSIQEIQDEEENYNMNLMNENCEYSPSFKFRKVSLGFNNSKKVNQNNNSFLYKQIILDTIRCCFSETTTLLASLLVESTTPDVMFNDKSWLEEDFLKVTIERDLHIARQFELNPVLWNLCELVAKNGFLQNCSVLIRALLAVNLTQWASATANKEKLKSTTKLVKLISQSELIPKILFKDIHLVLSFLDSWEIYCLLNDLWRFLKDNSIANANEKNFKVVKHYFERLRIIGGQKFPGVLFVKIFKNLNSQICS